MTPAGHTIIGLAFGTLSLPVDARCQGVLAHLTAFALLANVPDLPLPGWGHDAYHVSHSLFVNGLLLLLATLIYARLARASTVPQSRFIWWAAATTCLSHMLLDSLYNHGQGVLIGWPFCTLRLALPLPWFSVAPEPFLSLTTARIVSIEILFFLPFLLLAILWRTTILRPLENH